MPSLRARWTAMCVKRCVWKRFAWSSQISFWIPAALFAQGTGGRILGRVADPTGAVLGGVK